MENCDWAEIDATTADGYAQAMIQLTPVFIERFSDDLSAENIEVLERSTSKAEAYWRYTRECSNQVSVHCDYRCDNMLFGQRNGELSMVTIDWWGH